MRVTSEAWVLHARNWRDTSLLAELLTVSHGRIAAVVKGGRKRRIPLQPLMPLQISWTGRSNLKTILNYEEAGSVIDCQGRSLLASLYVNELLVRLLPDCDPCPGIYSIYSLLLPQLAVRNGRHWQRTLRHFEFQLFGELGYGIDFRYEAQGGNRIEPDRDYLLDIDDGIIASASPHYRSGAGSMGVYPGRMLLAIAAGRYDESPQIWHLSGELVSRVQQKLLNGRPLHSHRIN